MSTNQPPSSPAAIEREIEKTRAAMGHTLDAIQHKLSPQQIIADTSDNLMQAINGFAEQALGVIQSAASEMGTSLTQVFEHNPLLGTITSVGVMAINRPANAVSNQMATVGEQMRQPVSRLEQTLSDNPWLIGALIVAGGLALGLAIPESQPEHQIMGATRDNLLQQAKDTAQDTIQRVQTVAQDTAQRVQEVVQENLP